MRDSRQFPAAATQRDEQFAQVRIVRAHRRRQLRVAEEVEIERRLQDQHVEARLRDEAARARRAHEWRRLVLHQDVADGGVLRDRRDVHRHRISRFKPERRRVDDHVVAGRIVRRHGIRDDAEVAHEQRRELPRLRAVGIEQGDFRRRRPPPAPSSPPMPRRPRRARAHAAPRRRCPRDRASRVKPSPSNKSPSSSPAALRRTALTAFAARAAAVGRSTIAAAAALCGIDSDDAAHRRRFEQRAQCRFDLGGGHAERHHHGVNAVSREDRVEDFRRAHLVDRVGDAEENSGRAGDLHDDVGSGEGLSNGTKHRSRAFEGTMRTQSMRAIIAHMDSSIARNEGYCR